jgi:beta-phosphoglucomutase-like phosphatase (HAD superfamily)
VNQKEATEEESQPDRPTAEDDERQPVRGAKEAKRQAQERGKDQHAAKLCVASPGEVIGGEERQQGDEKRS